MPVIKATALPTGNLKGEDFTNRGPEHSNMVCIHANPRFETQWLE